MQHRCERFETPVETTEMQAIRIPPQKIDAGFERGLARPMADTMLVSRTMQIKATTRLVNQHYPSCSAP